MWENDRSKLLSYSQGSTTRIGPCQKKRKRYISITNTEISSIDNNTRRWTVSNRDTNEEIGTYATVGRIN